ncbi:programmed cell death protein 2-like [Ochotona princeps]|uniref:programmed cell death protein 2-like n=1 Tax=Ochotona princeps TaxID=9978 RepID=UPI002715129A|nr:programmed cell death protein 2-like [Ochotona princeps]
MAAVRKPVLLGLRDAAVRGHPTGPGAWTASKLGGVPDALPAVAAPRPACARCGAPLALVVQVYCPLEGSPFHRLLHVFACARPGCGGSRAHSWKVFRSQCLQVPEKEAQLPQKQENGLDAQDWCDGADDWGSDSEEVPPSQAPLDCGNGPNSSKGRDWTTQLQHLHLQDAAPDATQQGQGVTLPTVPPLQFLPYYIAVVDEDDYRDCAGLDHAQNLLRDYQHREGVALDQLLSQDLPNDGDEKYEKTVIKSGDQLFYRFMKRIAACREQILRYSWSGEPLLLMRPVSDVTEPPACSHCGGPRTFEFQLMPALVSMLQAADPGVSVEFGTILVYTCERSCWPPNHPTPLEEFCVVQEDPDELLFK